LGCEAPNTGGLASHDNERLYTLGADVDRRMDIDRGFSLFEILGLKIYSLESYESPRLSRDWYPDVYLSFASYSFYRPKVAYFSR